MSYQAYKTASSRTEDPRQTEYRLLGEVTRGLMEVREAPKSEIRQRVAALDRNRRVWSAFAADCASSANNLPESLRALLPGFLELLPFLPHWLIHVGRIAERCGA